MRYEMIWDISRWQLWGWSDFIQTNNSIANWFIARLLHNMHATTGRNVMRCGLRNLTPPPTKEMSLSPISARIQGRNKQTNNGELLPILSRVLDFLLFNNVSRKLSFVLLYKLWAVQLAWTTQGGARASLAIMSRASFSFNVVTCRAFSLKIFPTKHKTFWTLLTAHFVAVSYKAVCGHLHKNGIFGPPRRNTGEIWFPGLTAKKWLRQFSKICLKIRVS